MYVINKIPGKFIVNFKISFSLRMMNEQLLMELSPEIERLNRVSDKVQFIYNHLAATNEFPNYNLTPFKKSTERSIVLRKKANNLFTRKHEDDLYNALEMYNACICFAENDSEELSIAFANRSAVYFELRLYERCLENIALVKLMSTYPTRLLDKLLQRESQCMSELSDGHSLSKENLMEQYTFEPKILHRPHTEVPGISETLLLKESTKYGRYVITTKDIEPGEIISIASPYESALKKSFFYKRCSFCLSENHLSLIPCTGCTSAMFCNTKCMMDSLQSFHGFECSIVGYINAELDSWPLAIRLTILSFMSFESVEQLDTFIEQYRNIKSTVFTPLIDANLTKKQIHLHQIISLENNEKHMSSSALFNLYVSTANIFNILMQYTKFGALCSGSKCFDDSKQNAISNLLELLYRFHLIVKSNAHAMIQLSAGETDISYASGIYPFCSMLNHSCVLNVERFYKNKQMVLVAVRSIKAGEQIFDNYGWVFICNICRIKSIPKIILYTYLIIFHVHGS